MPEREAFVRLSVGNVTIEVSGSEDFVESQLDQYEHFLQDAESAEAQVEEYSNQTPSTAKENLQDGPDEYSDIFGVSEDGEVSFRFYELPGNGYKESQINCAILYLYALSTANKDPKVDTDVIRKICDEYREIDSNFLSNLRDEKKALDVEGEGKSHTVRLTPPGHKKAKQIIDTYREGETE